MLNRHSVKFKITLLLSGIILLLVIVLLFINSTCAETFYIRNIQKSMLKGYNDFNVLEKKYKSGRISLEQMQNEMEYLTTDSNWSVIVIDSAWSTLYTNINGEAEMINRLKKSMFNSDIFKPDEDEKIKKPEGIYLPGEIINMDMSGVDEKRIIINENEMFTLQKVYDSRLLDYYYELWGNLDGGSFIMIRVNAQSIKDSVDISNTFIKYVGFLVMLLGICSAYMLSRYISNPIKELSVLSERMSRLDFNARYEGNDKGEIGALGASMNNMSDILEENISRLKKANIELRKDIDQKEKNELMRQEFISNVSHELKTPIALIQGYAEGLKESVIDDEQSKEFYCDVIIDEANKMNNLVKELLTLNQMESGNQELVMERFNAALLVRAVVSANELMASNKGISIEYDIEDEIMDVWSDEYKLEQVITNYVTNAINHCDYPCEEVATENKTTTADKLIKITLKRVDGNVRLGVYNTGKHIPDQEIDKIWQKFYKVDKARTREYGGNGIGLSIVKAIADMYNNQYGVKNIEGGVEFWFDLDSNA